MNAGVCTWRWKQPLKRPCDTLASYIFNASPCNQNLCQSQPLQSWLTHKQLYFQQDKIKAKLRNPCLITAYTYIPQPLHSQTQQQTKYQQMNTVWFGSTLYLFKFEQMSKHCMKPVQNHHLVQNLFCSRLCLLTFLLRKKKLPNTSLIIIKKIL